MRNIGSTADDARHPGAWIATLLPRRAHGCGATQQHRRDGEHLGVPDLLAQAGQMTSMDMAGFVRDHADQLVGRFGLHDRAQVDEDTLAIRHEGIEGAIIDEDDLAGIAADSR